MSKSRASIAASLLGIAIFGTVAATDASAVPITFNFAGILDQIDTDSPGTFPALSIGTTISGSYTFESEAPDTNPSQSTSGTFYPVPSVITFDIGTLQLSFSNLFFATRSNHLGAPDEYFLSASQEFYPLGSTFVRASFWLDLRGTSSMASDELPLVPPDLSLFDTLQFSLYFVNYGSPINAHYSDYRGTLTSLTAAPVPIPAALPLFAAGLSAMGYMGWRRKRKSAAYS